MSVSTSAAEPELLTPSMARVLPEARLIASSGLPSVIEPPIWIVIAPAPFAASSAARKVKVSN